MLDAMVDLETMGKSPDAAIIAIGVVLFDAETLALGAQFYEVVDLKSSVDAGAVINPDTVMWWLKQDKAAQYALYKPGVRQLPELQALHELTEFIHTNSDPDKVRVWGNGAAFDNVILASAYARYRMAPPWKYSNNRCFRTLKAEHPDVPMQRTGVYHNALDDARTQATHAIKLLSRKHAYNLA